MKRASGPESDSDFARWSNFPGARSPDRTRSVAAGGLRLAVHEWGPLDAPPLLLAHGGFDFAQTFSAFAPLLADVGWRVVCWDQRGHGDSEHAALYSWEADARDGLAVLDTLSPKPIPLLGHSKGGALLMHIAHACPHRVSRLINIDGIPSGQRHPDVADHERTRLLAEELSGWLDHRRRAADLVRRPDHIEGLARRRARMNPRLSHEWLCFLVTRGAQHDADGWRWKIDPALRFGGFGPSRPDWAMQRLPSLAVPLLGILAGEDEPMGWHTRPEHVEPYLPTGARLHCFAGAGHFVHIEKPREVAELVLEFLRT